jgi:hypothetical protein
MSSQQKVKPSQVKPGKIFGNVKPSQVKPEKFAGLPRPVIYPVVLISNFFLFKFRLVYFFNQLEKIVEKFIK